MTIEIETKILIDGEYSEISIGERELLSEIVKNLNRRIFVDATNLNIESAKIVEYRAWYHVTFYIISGAVSFHDLHKNESVFWLHFFSDTGYSILEIKIEKEMN